MQSNLFNPNSEIFSTGVSELLSEKLNITSELNEKQIHIRIKQRKQRSFITTVDNLPENISLEKILKKMKQTFHCIGSIQTSTEGKYLQFSGDQRLGIKKFLIESELAREENIHIHGC